MYRWLWLKIWSTVIYGSQVESDERDAYCRPGQRERTMVEGRWHGGLVVDGVDGIGHREREVVTATLL